MDFVTDAAGRLAPTGTNLRLTGPSVAVAFMGKADQERPAAERLMSPRPREPGMTDRTGAGARQSSSARPEGFRAT
ncbi:hypothetical protein [Streptomyces sp. NPDC051219]|uniref:hypothetical protein n=1 Tax=Streptomyces sp. NPDC051219 TaxID=3155283 RepID=UPI00342CC0B1